MRWLIMKNIQTKLLIVSCIILCISSAYVGYQAYESITTGVISLLVVLVPAGYSLIPLIKEQIQKRNKQKNRLTASMFTDRRKDLEAIAKKLSTQEHILEIKGNEEQCGKTWLAKRLYDYVNFPKDSMNIEVNVKCPYNKAYYINMDDYSEKELNDFFQSESINSKVVLIFDHVKDIDTIIDKQELYHFQLVYILKDTISRDLSSHIISEFDPKHINELQEKIKNYYPGITNITQQEINVLFKLTNGNIGKIHALLCEQKCINWIKDIAANRQTEYDEKLNQIQAILYMGNYSKARKELDGFEYEYKQKFEENNDLYYKYTLMLSDCEHLLNNYEKASSILTILETSQFKSNNINYEVELHKAHYYKHLWKCNEALEILQKLKLNLYKASVDALGILVAKYFINDLYVPMSGKNSLDEFLSMYAYVQNSTLPHTDDDKLKLQRCASIFTFYTEHPKTCEKLIEKAHNVISIYKAQNNRLLANAYFIQGEIYRLYQKYELAINEYKKCLNVTKDDNIIIQTNLMVYYLKRCKQIEVNFNLLCEEKIMEMCEKNNYSKIILQRIHSVELNDPDALDICKCFDNRLMPIL